MVSVIDQLISRAYCELSVTLKAPEGRYIIIVGTLSLNMSAKKSLANLEERANIKGNIQLLSYLLYISCINFLPTPDFLTVIYF